ncbi:phosphotransferase [Nonomuraea sp. NN258]|uniref:phosphotransferase family protein n=1 Tax=Nonomuraea antri TaxID=2730852 RepID=UPI0015689945|nr:phosphotransferase [Nonomuraea antri]NRQ40037.1 phosphotransferase [Nonomuraea antri]
MIGDVRALLSRHLPDYEVRRIVPFGHGLDNAVYTVNDELVVRYAKAADPGVTRREVELLAVVRELVTLPVPEVVAADPDAGAIAYRLLPGRPLNEEPTRDPERLAEPLGRFLTELHAAPAERVRPLAPLDLYPPPNLLRDAELDYRDVEQHVPEDQRPLVEGFLRAPAPPEPKTLRLCHNDLGSEHLLADAETSVITGVIDWTDAAVTDPAGDFGLIYRDLGPEVFELVLSHYDHDFDEMDRERAIFYARCALIEDLAYGLSTGPRHYATTALSHLTWTFS